MKLILGCNYHLKTASSNAMRFMLVELKEDKARLKTDKSKKDFWVDVNDLEFIESGTNLNKAYRLEKLAKQYIFVKPLTFGEWKDIPLYLVPLTYVQWLRKRTDSSILRNKLITEEKRRRL